MSSNSKKLAHMAAANVYSQLSKARRMKVGAVLVRDDRIISVGYNGTISGGDNNCEIEEADGTLVTKREVLHAEENVILFAAKNGMSTNGCTLYITASPCFNCARMIIQCGIQRVYYRDEYRDTAGIEFLNNNDVLCMKLEDGDEASMQDMFQQGTHHWEVPTQGEER